jgi:hypothetical protein
VTSTPTKSSAHPSRDLSPTKTPREIKQSHLFSSVERPLADPLVETFTITGLHAHDDVESIKKMCTGIHVVTIAPDMDDIQGRCTG